MSRLILLCGVGGVDTTAIAAATVEALTAEGLACVPVDGNATPVDGAQGMVSAALGPILGEIGADPVAQDAWSGLVDVAHLDVLLRTAAALAESPAVVLDAGDVRSARALAALPGILLRLLDAALTPRLAMWRGSAGADVAFDALSAARLSVLDLATMLARESTTARIVAPPSRSAVEPAVEAMSVLSMLGVGVDGIVVDRYPRKSEGWPRSVVDEAAATLAALTAAAEGIPVWKSTSRTRAVPKGRAASGPLGPVHVLDADQLVVSSEDEALLLDLPMTAFARRSARVGVLDDHLVVSLGGTSRWLDLPAALRRCEATEAVRTGDGLRVRFSPDPGLWREPAQRGQERANGPAS